MVQKQAKMKIFWGSAPNPIGGFQHPQNPPANRELALASSVTASSFPMGFGAKPQKIFYFLLIFEPFRSHLGDIMTLIVT